MGGDVIFAVPGSEAEGGPDVADAWFWQVGDVWLGIDAGVGAVAYLAEQRALRAVAA